jgi:hypothetical protein
MAAFLAGCGGMQMNPPPPPPPGGETLALGAPAPDGTGFTPLSENQDVTLVEGAQGGFHVWMKYRLPNAVPERLDIDRTAHRVSDGALVLRAAGQVDVGAPGPDGAWETPDPLRMFMCPTPVGIKIVDEAIHYEIDLLDAQMTRVGHGEITLVPHCPQQNEQFCLQICSG